MHEVFNMGCGFCVVVAAEDEAAALALLRAPLPGGEADRRAVEAAGEIAAPERESRPAPNPSTDIATAIPSNEPMDARSTSAR